MELTTTGLHLGPCAFSSILFLSFVKLMPVRVKQGWAPRRHCAVRSTEGSFKICCSFQTCSKCNWQVPVHHIRWSRCGCSVSGGPGVGAGYQVVPNAFKQGSFHKTGRQRSCKQMSSLRLTFSKGLCVFLLLQALLFDTTHQSRQTA